MRRVFSDQQWQRLGGGDSVNVTDSVRGEGFRGCIGARDSQRKKERGNSVERMGLGESEELNGMTECPAAWCHPFEWSPLCHQTCVLLCAEDPSPITVGDLQVIIKQITAPHFWGVNQGRKD